MYRPAHFFAAAIALLGSGVIVANLHAPLVAFLLLIPGLLMAILGLTQTLSVWAKQDLERMRRIAETNRNSWPRH